MIKTIMYYYLLLSMAVRAGDLVYVLTRESTNVPVVVFLFTTATVLYGIVLLVKRFIGPVRIRQLRIFYLIQAAVIVFNLAYVSITCPLQISPPETVIIGTFLDLLINFALVYACTKQMHSKYSAIVQTFAEES